MTKPNYQKAEFILSVADLKQLPPDQGTEIAIVGRSNSGKSSVLNQLTRNKNLARTSKVPGRTQLINLFKLDDNRRIADLPGYGYAKVPMSLKKQWEQLINQYLHSRDCLRGLILVMDIRHPLKPHDQVVLDWCNDCHFPVHILLNKADKLSAAQQKLIVQLLTKSITRYACPVTFQLFSALKGTGTKELQEQLNQWFD